MSYFTRNKFIWELEIDRPKGPTSVESTWATYDEKGFVGDVKRVIRANVIQPYQGDNASISFDIVTITRKYEPDGIWVKEQVFPGFTFYAYDLIEGENSDTDWATGRMIQLLAADKADSIDMWSVFFRLVLKPRASWLMNNLEDDNWLKQFANEVNKT